MPNQDSIPILNQENQSNFTTLKVIKEGASPVLGAVGIGNYFGQILSQPLLGALAAICHIPHVGVSIWNIVTPPHFKNKVVNGVRKISLGTGLLILANYQQWVNEVQAWTTLQPSTFNPTSTIPSTTISTTTLEPSTTISTTTSSPITSTTTLGTSTTTNPFIGSSSTSMNTVNPFTSFPRLALGTSIEDQINASLVSYSVMNSYGIVQILSGVGEFLPSKLRKGLNTLSGILLTTNGICMGVTHGFDNTAAPVTTIAGIIEIVNALAPRNQPSNDIQLQETHFNSQSPHIINALETNRYGSIGTMDTISLDSDIIIWDRDNPYQPTSTPLPL